MKAWVWLAIVLALVPSTARAWGTTGHHLINLVAMRGLPTYLPGFVRTPEAIEKMEAFGTEPDRLKGAGDSFDRDANPGHFVDVGDDGKIAGVIALDALPNDMDAYDTALRAAGYDPYKVGYSPYAIADGWEIVRKDFAYWRAFDYLAAHAATPEYRAKFEAEKALREDLTIRDVGVWAHFVGDGSQPLHTSVHYNDGGIHAPFEGAFVRDHVTAEAVEKLVPIPGPTPPPALLSQRELMRAIGAYLSRTNSHVAELYAIAKAGGFREGTPQAVAFADARVADGATELRNLVMLAFDNSLYESVGYPAINVQRILDGDIRPTPADFGRD